MGKYTRKCSDQGCEISIMEVAPAGVRTRGRAMATAAEESADNSGSAKRMKVVGNGELRLSSSRITDSDGGDVITTLKNYGDSAVEELRDFSGDVPASCCSSNGSVTEILKSVDLEERTEVETTMTYKMNRRESTQTTDLKAESGELHSTNTSKPSVVIDSRRKTPPAAELEEFFAKAEENLHKRFKDKYNYDIVKDVPLKGRFEWVELKP
ncbi:unnamed protein product [Lactuca virosa]|uniref:Cyclin-dependent kinase inhibitor n=1 Tax=Lactuca virosa TaxID=75947 RepID=A0AAU9MGP3_9ASTR|nr:unnamed protein product [Lactuca virosa]